MSSIACTDFDNPTFCFMGTPGVEHRLYSDVTDVHAQEIVENWRGTGKLALLRHARVIVDVVGVGVGWDDYAYCIEEGPTPFSSFPLNILHRLTFSIVNAHYELWHWIYLQSNDEAGRKSAGMSPMIDSG